MKTKNKKDDIILTIFSSRLARSSSIFWNGVLLACCSCNFSCSFLFRFRFSIARSNSDFVFRTSMPLEYNKKSLLDYRNFQRLKYLLSVQLLVNIFCTIFLLWFGLLCINHFILSSQYFGVSKLTMCILFE